MELNKYLTPDWKFGSALAQAATALQTAFGQKQDIGYFPVEPDLHRRAVEDQSNDVFTGEARTIPFSQSADLPPSEWLRHSHIFLAV